MIIFAVLTLIYADINIVLYIYGSLFLPQDKKIKKAIATFYLTILNSYLTIVSLQSEWKNIKSEWQDINLQS